MKRIGRPGSRARMAPTAFAATIAATVLAAAGTPAAATQDRPPEGVQPIIPRGAIPAVFEPTFVSADEADIPDDAWVLGVVVRGDARAYDLNLLNHHEIVNDVVGGLPVAPTW